ISGPGIVTFDHPNSTDTAASFSAPGVYILRMTASDGDLASYNDVVISVLDNAAPVVDSGPQQTIILPSVAHLNAKAFDDGFPVPPGALTGKWSVVSGPGAVSFADEAASTTTASFETAGSYMLRFTATDGALETSSDITITVLQNNAPVV